MYVPSCVTMCAVVPYERSDIRVWFHGVVHDSAQVLLGGPSLVEPRLLAAVRGLVATYQSEVENLTLEVLGSWDRPLNKRNEVGVLWCDML